MLLTNNATFVSENRQSVADLIVSTLGKSYQEAEKTIASTGISNLSVFQNDELMGLMKIAVEILNGKNVGILGGVSAIIVVSQTYDMALPSISTRIQGLLGLSSKTFCIDVNDGCCGFIKASKIAKMLIESGYSKVLVISGDINSRITKNSDLSTRILFGDGFSFSTFEASNDSYVSELHNNGLDAEFIRCKMNTSELIMNGFEVFRFTKNVVPPLMREFLKKIDGDEIDLVGLHQASRLIVNSLSSSLAISTRYGDFFNCSKIGNLGSGSIGSWLANVPEVPFNKKLKMLAIGYGAGLSWGVANFCVNIDGINEVISVNY